MATQPTTGSGDSAVGRHRRSVYRLGRIGAGRAMIAVATALAAGSVGLLVLASWGAGGHRTLLPAGGEIFASDTVAPRPHPLDGSGPPAPSPAPSQVVTAATTTPAPSAATPVRSGGAAAGGGPAAPPTTPSTPAPPGKPVLSYEAEASGNVRSPRTSLRQVPRASGGYVVTGIGDGATLRFVVAAPSAGRYTLTVYYVAGERRGATMRVDNGRTVGAFLPSTGDWYTVGSVTVPVDLVSGGNTIEFGNPRGPAPDVDRILLH